MSVLSAVINAVTSVANDIIGLQVAGVSLEGLFDAGLVLAFGIAFVMGAKFVYEKYMKEPAKK